MVAKDYETIFSKEIEITMADYITSSFLHEIVSTISRRMSIKDSNVRLSFSTDIGAKFKTSNKQGVEKILTEAKKYKRAINSIIIETGIVHKDKKSNTHYSVTLRIQRIQNRFYGYLYVYAVAGDVSDSQYVIDWGTGFLGDFEKLNISETELGHETLAIAANDGAVRALTDEERLRKTTLQKVEVVNTVKTASPKWTDKTTLIALAALVLTIIIAAIGWVFFPGGNT